MDIFYNYLKMREILIVIVVLLFLSVSFASGTPEGNNAHPAEFKDPLTGVEFMFVKGGCYEMGDGSNIDNPTHEVCVDDFYIGRHVVTQKQWREVMGHNPSNFSNCGDDCPVESISWNDTQEFIKKLNEKTPPLGSPLSKGEDSPSFPLSKGGQRGLYRLPTEAEWEYAAKSGGRKEKWAGTNNESELGDYAWYEKNSGSKTHPVGRKKPNGLGLYDMNGNVWQFVQDRYDRDYFRHSPKNNPQGPASGEVHVLRGGSWARSARVVCTTYRINSLNPAVRFNTSGFRLARGLSK